MQVKLPKLGEGAETGTVVSLLVKEGDRVEKGQTILELENEKAVAPIPSDASGTVLDIQVKVGDQISVGQVILALGENERESVESTSGSSPQRVAPPPDPKTDQPSPQAQPVSPSQTLMPSVPLAVTPVLDSSNAKTPVAPPSIRKVARELGIDLARVHGSGPGGRIAMADLRAYVEHLQHLALSPPATPASAPPSLMVERVDFSKWGPIHPQPFSPRRQTISRRMAENWNAIPHVTQFDEVDITLVNQLRKKFYSEYEAKGAKLTLTAFVVQAVASILKKHSLFNASIDETNQSVIFKDYYHIGLAVDTDQGLLVPVLRDADKLSLLELARNIDALAEKARSRKLTLEEMKGGSFTISNQGGIGGGFFTPIINRPEVAILGLGRGALKPVFRDGQVMPRWLMPIGLSYDHRLIDGASAARFVVDLAAAFQDFSETGVALPRST